MLRADKFEAALDREMYNCWGAGGYRFNYESGIDWQYRQLNNTDWLHYKTKLKRSPERRKNYVFLNETFSTAITERRILEIKIRLSANCDKDKYSEFVAWIENAQQLIINSISLDMDPAWYKNNRQIKAKYSDIKRTQSRDKVIWTEKINNLFEIRRQPGMPLYDVSDDYLGKTELEEMLIINFDEMYDSTFVLNVPQANKTAHPAIKKLLEQQKTLADKIHKTLESHCGNNPARVITHQSNNPPE